MNKRPDHFFRPRILLSCLVVALMTMQSARAETTALVMPRADARVMNVHLAESSRTVAPGAHAVLVLDGAGWHGAKALSIPDNITLLPLPP